MNEQYTRLDTYRYERKFVTPLHRSNVEAVLMCNAAFFSTVYKPRRINNIYFDTPGLDCYFDNLFGNGERWKARLRWYGDVFVEEAQPVLEFKIKKGLVGTKESFPLPVLNTTNEGLSQTNFKAYFDKANLPLAARAKIRDLQPVLLNSYDRKYFLSGDKKFRVTIDDNLEYYNLRSSWNSFHYKFSEYNKTVLELKYDKALDFEAGRISNEFPFRLDKNSKFVAGMKHFRNEVPE